MRVKPGARDDHLEQLADGTWTARVKAPPVGGKANAALVSLVARHFDLPRSRVSISGGASSRQKRVTVDD